MRQLFAALGLLLLMTSCDKDQIISVVYPKDYLPAYPGSYWTYSNGERTTVKSDYVVHSFQASITSAEYTSPKRVPCIDNEYLYEYEITQNSMLYPLKKLLSEKIVNAWVVNEVNGENIYRETVQVMDSLYLKFPSDEAPVDSVLYPHVVVVIEYQESLGETKWNVKEYYAKKVGLIRVEINNPYDTLPPIVKKQLLTHNQDN